MSVKISMAIFGAILLLMIAIPVALAGSSGGRTIWNSGGIWCKGSRTVGVTCIPYNNLGGYGVAISKYVVLVEQFGESGHGWVIFKRAQP